MYIYIEKYFRLKFFYTFLIFILVYLLYNYDYMIKILFNL